MIGFNSFRTVGRSMKHCIVMKNSLSKVKHQLAFLHTSKILWSTYPMEIKMPSLSPTMTEGTIVKWLKKEGDTIEPGDALCEIQTDKAVVALETEEEGVLEKIVIPEDTKNVKLGEIIAIVTVEGEAPVSQSASTPAKPSEGDKLEDVSSKNVKIDPFRLIGPSVKKLLNEYDLKLSDVQGSGRLANLLKGDVLQHISKHNLKPVIKTKEKLESKKVTAPKPSSKGAHLDIPVTSSTSANAQQLLHSKRTIPHGYMSIDCNIDKIFDYIKKYKKDGLEVNLNEFLVKSAILALKQVPRLNISRENGQLKMIDSINILITNYNDGLRETCILKNAQSLNVQSLSKQLKFSQIAEENIGPAKNVFRISNLSSFGISDFTEIISPTDVAVMGVGGVQYIFEDDKPVKKLNVTLSFDNYIIGETEAGEFLETFKKCLENPLNMICIG